MAFGLLRKALWPLSTCGLLEGKGQRKTIGTNQNLNVYFFPGLTELIGTNSQLSLCLVVVALAGFGREKGEYRKS